MESPEPFTLLYKHAWMKQWQEGYETTPEFAARQADPIRRQLTGSLVWHHGREHFPAAALPSGAENRQVPDAVP